MLTHTVKLGTRDRHRLRLTYEEAIALMDKGFRFSIFRPPEDTFLLSIPYQMAEDREHDTLTFMQDEER